jgi:syntaxin-binding protein 1
MSVFNNRGLNKLAILEQDMATGEDTEGRAVKNILSNLAPLLTDSTLPYVI